MKLQYWLCAALVIAISMALVATPNGVAAQDGEPAEKTQDGAAEEGKDKEGKNKEAEEDKSDQPAEVVVQVEELLTGLNNPTGVAVAPGNPDVVYVAESGAGKIMRVDPAKPGKSEDVITDFKLDVYGTGPKYKIGPLGLAFLDKQTLIVADGSLPDVEELVRIYALPEDGKPLKCDETKYKLGPLPPAKDSELGEGNFYAVATDGNALYVTCNGDDTKGWIARALLEDGEPQELETFIATKEFTNVDTPVGITINRRGDIVVGQMGEVGEPKDSLITFYSAKTGSMLMNLKIGLHDIVGLAYNPGNGRLYAIDFAWTDEKEGGLYRIDATYEDEKVGARAVKILSLKKPTALAFGHEMGKPALYVTEMGEADAKAGRLLKITGDL